MRKGRFDMAPDSRDDAPVPEDGSGHRVVEDLKERLRQCQAACRKTLHRERARLAAALEQQREDSRDIIEHLKGDVAQKAESVLTLEERLQSLVQRSDRDRERVADSRRREQQEARDEAERLHALISEQSEELERVQSFRDAHVALLAELARAREEAARHEKLVVDLERKHLVEKDGLKKEMLCQLQARVSGWSLHAS